VVRVRNGVVSFLRVSNCIAKEADEEGASTMSEGNVLPLHCRLRVMYFDNEISTQ